MDEATPRGWFQLPQSSGQPPSQPTQPVGQVPAPTRLGRVVFVTMIPAGLLLLLWVWFGRAFFGVLGWMLFVLPLMVLPWVVGALLISTILAFARLTSPRAFNQRETIAQLSIWGGLFVAGALMPDFGDQTGDGSSLLTQIFGQSEILINVSWWVVFAAGAVALMAWISLVRSLISRPSRRAVSGPPTGWSGPN